MTTYNEIINLVSRIKVLEKEKMDLEEYIAKVVDEKIKENNKKKEKKEKDIE